MINIIYPKDGWILQSMAEKLVNGIPGSRGVDAREIDEGNFSSILEDSNTKLNYYINYALFKKKSEKIDCAWFTHPEKDNRFFSVASQVNFAVCNAEKYRRELTSRGVAACTLIPGIDASFQPKLVVGFVGRFSTYGQRKGIDLLEKLSKLDWIELRLTNGGVAQADLPKFFSDIDCVLISSRYEGGPMCLLEGLACGKPVVCPPDVGIAEFFIDQITPYVNGDFCSLSRVLRGIYGAKLTKYNSVKKYTWERWVELHSQLFTQLISGASTKPDSWDFIEPIKRLPVDGLAAQGENASKVYRQPEESAVTQSHLPLLNRFANAMNRSQVLLHLGCGGKYIDGWINIDYFDYEAEDSSRSGSTYDVKMDIRNLDVADGTVSKILMVHVLEHFVRWEALDMLKHYYLKLQPGGELIIEMPDLDQCISWYLTRPDKVIQTPLGVLNKGFTQFYGNQWDRLDYETHRYVWTKNEFSESLKEIGFSIKELGNSARFHESGRDMFVRVIKP